jgi:nucleoside 2-deoxyribosyltransferase
MNTNIFGIAWENDQPTCGEFGGIHFIEHKKFGNIYISYRAYDNGKEHIKTEDNYIYQSMLREKQLNKTRLLICDEEETEQMIGFKGGGYEILPLQNIIKLFPKSIVEKEKRTLLNLSKIEPEFGIGIKEIHTYDSFSKNEQQMLFILNILQEKSLIKISNPQFADNKLYEISIFIKEKGWIQIEELEKPLNSKQAFIAMWFHESMKYPYSKIAEACERNHFNPLRIDTKEYNNEISGEILAEIQKSRFLIAEVTGQRPGVYFEAGYALSLGIPVIWCVKKDDLNNVHFDTRQYNHVVWDNEEVLYEKMFNRIKGTIIYNNLTTELGN